MMLISSKELSSPKKKLLKEKEKSKNQLKYLSIEVGDKLKVEFISSSNISQVR